MNSFFGITTPVVSNNSFTSIIPTSPRDSPVTVPVTVPVNQEESSSSETQEKILNEVSMTLISLIELNINLPSFQLTDDEKRWIQLLISNSPASFSPLDSFLSNVLSSGKLSIENIPEMIELFANVFNKTSIELNIANSHNIYVLIKFIMDILIDIIPLSYIEIAIIKSVAYSSLSLLSTVLADSTPNTTSNSTNTSVEPENTVTSADVVSQDVSANVISQEVVPEVSIQDISNNEVRGSAQVLVPEVTTNKCCTFFKFW
jgi:hypothetical protein